MQKADSMSDDDVNMNYSQSYVPIEIKGELTSCYVDRGEQEHLFLSLRTKDEWVRATYNYSNIVFFPELLPPLGFVQVGNSTMFLSKGLQRQFKRGYTRRNVVSRNAFVSPEYAREVEETREQFIKAVFEERPKISLLEAVKKLRENERLASVVANDELAVGWMQWELPVVSWNGSGIGWIQDNNKMLLIKEHAWLKPKVEDHLEVQDVI